ncbi:MAG: cupin-like domain-containing protein [Polyangiaceae bacterium]|nr:cupin-like domain-containing protein [Polyangiaceae bacterium]
MIRRSRSVRRRVPRVLPVTLSNEWRAWVVENAVGGLPAPQLVDTLVEAGIPRRLAAAEVSAVFQSPIFSAARSQFRKAERLSGVLRLLREAASAGAFHKEVERRETITQSEFRDVYIAGSRPLVLTHLLPSWPAFQKWTPAYLAEHFGDVEVEVMAGRNADPKCDRNLDLHRRKLPFREFIHWVETATSSNDMYMVSNNRVFELPGFAPLLADITPPPQLFDTPVLPGHASLWMGAAGSVTPLHHDVSNNLVCQIFGEKTFYLFSTLSTQLVLGADGFSQPAAL